MRNVPIDFFLGIVDWRGNEWHGYYHVGCWQSQWPMQYEICNGKWKEMDDGWRWQYSNYHNQPRGSIILGLVYRG